MKKVLALIITSDKYLNHIVGLIEAAAKKDCDIKIFITDKGVFLTENSEFIAAVKKNDVCASVCEYSCGVNGILSRKEEFNYASQFENSKMLNGLKKNDRVLLF